MSRQIQIRRGTAAEHDNFTGAIGEITMDTTNKTLRVHDGVTVGGNKLMLASDKPTINITNCITEIPQDIKFELNSGTLKLKSGSKIWIPNGKNADINDENYGDTLYTQTTIQNDITVGTQSATGQTMVFYNYTTPGARADILTSSCIAGTSGSANSIVLNKNTNIIDYYNNSNVAEGSQYSFPLALVTVANGSVTSIDKVFNGFGFIDSIMFALPEIKYLIPNGRNDDGSPYSTESVVQTVLTCSLSGTNDKLPIVIGGNSITSDSLFEYDESNNTTPNNKVLVGYVDTVSGQITSFYTRPVFHLADYSDLKSIKDIVGITTESFSKSQSGYYKLDNGLIIQWVQVTNASQNGVYTLPTAFSSGTSYIAIPTFNNENEGGADPVQIWQQTSTTVSLHRYGGMSGNDIGIIAIGY